MITRTDPVLGVAPGRSDGRNVDPEAGSLAGEAAGQRVEQLRAPPPDEVAVRDGEGPSYHGMPLLKDPVWKWEIPLYFYVGGLTGACAVLGAAAQAAGGSEARELVRRCRLAAVGGAGVSAALLIKDLGRPARFLHMLRVFRPTSPMNMGTWVLTAFGGFAALAALPLLAPSPRAVARTGDAAAYAAGALGLPLVGYTGVLISNTAVPVWQETRRTLPVLFAFSGAASAGDLFELWSPGGLGARIAERLGALATGAELAASLALRREAGRIPRVARPLSRGRSGLLFTAGEILALGSLVTSLLAPGRSSPARLLRPGRRSRLHALSGLLGTAGTLLLRFGIMAAGTASARDPHATFAQQRAGRGAAELVREERAPGVVPSLAG